MPASIRIATFNLESLDWRSRDDERFEDRITALRPVLNDLEADILCLQEVNAQPAQARRTRELAALEVLLETTRYARFARAATTSPHGTGPYDVHNLVILSRFPIVEQRQLLHELVKPWAWSRPAHTDSGPPGIDIVWERPMLYTRIEPPGGPALHVINLHLRAPRAAFIPGAKDGGIWSSTAAWAEGFFLASQERAGQALEARLLVEQLFDKDPEARIAVCGDLNADEHETPARLLCANAAAFGDASRNRRLLVGVSDRIPQAQRYSVIHAGRRVMLDHILVSEPLARTCVEVIVCNRALVDETRAPEGMASSLHAPVVAVFR